MAHDPIIFAMANPDPEIGYEEARVRRARRHRGHRAQRLPQPGQQRPRLPVHLPRRARRARDRDQRRDEAGGGPRARRAGARGRARRRAARLRPGHAASSAASTSSPSRSTTACCCAWRRRWPRPRWRPAWRAPRSRTSTPTASAWSTLISRRLELMRGIIDRAKRDPKRIVFPEGEHDKILRAAKILVERGHRPSDPAGAARA